MKKILFVLFAGVALLSCSTKEGYKIKGEIKVPGYSENTKVYLSNLDPDNRRRTIPIDSTTIKSPNYFEFEKIFTDSVPTEFKLIEIIDGDKRQVGVVFIEKGLIRVSVDSTSIRAKGTPLNDKKYMLDSIYLSYSEKMKPLVAQYKTLTPDSELAVELDQKMVGLHEQFSSDLFSLIKLNAANLVGQNAFLEQAYNYDVSQLEEILALIPDNVKQSNKRIAQWVQKVNLMKKTSVGQRYIDLTGKNPEGKNISLSDYVGKNKLILVDFWASWCPPCRKAMPGLIKLYNEYHKAGFEIVGVSLDKDQESWENGIKELGLLWPQMSDLKFWESDLAKEYAVSSIPYTVLIDKEGIIVATKLDEADLEKMLKEKLK